MAFQLRSPAFADNERIPTLYAQEGQGISPPLEWQDPPAQTRSFVLVMDDPDAPRGTFRHWAVFDIAPACTGLPAGTQPSAELKHGVTDTGEARYVGPHPPVGHGLHHYHFRLMALDTDHLDLPASPTVADVEAVARKHAIGHAALTGVYSREL